MNRTSYNLSNHVHHLTYSCFHRQQLLTSDDLRLMLLESWNEAREVGKFMVWAYVIMPEHVHLLICPREEDYALDKILRLLKEGFTRRVVGYWQAHSPDLLSRIHCLRGQRMVNRFWQDGGGYDRNLYEWKTIRKTIDYIEWNPVRRKLVANPTDWPWSSARARSGRKDVPFYIDEIQI
jgi:putative transposase